MTAQHSGFIRILKLHPSTARKKLHNQLAGSGLGMGKKKRTYLPCLFHQSSPAFFFFTCRYLNPEKLLTTLHIRRQWQRQNKPKCYLSSKLGYRFTISVRRYGEHAGKDGRKNEERRHNRLETQAKLPSWTFWKFERILVPTSNLLQNYVSIHLFITLQQVL